MTAVCVCVCVCVRVCVRVSRSFKRAGPHPSRKLARGGTVADIKAGPLPTKYHIPIAALQNFMAHKGIGCERKRGDPFSHMLERLQSTPGFVSMKDLFSDCARLGKSSVIIKAILGKLVMPDFTTFARNLQAMFHISQVRRVL
jgi:hypothetical protein